jgi:hypothetical protein
MNTMWKEREETENDIIGAFFTISSEYRYISI